MQQLASKLRRGRHWPHGFYEFSLFSGRMNMLAVTKPFDSLLHKLPEEEFMRNTNQKTTLKNRLRAVLNIKCRSTNKHSSVIWPSVWGLVINKRARTCKYRNMVHLYVFFASLYTSSSRKRLYRQYHWLQQVPLPKAHTQVLTSANSTWAGGSTLWNGEIGGTVS